MTDEHVRKHVVRYWDWRAATYDSQPGQSDREGAWERIWESCFPASEVPAKILDIGAGTGFCSLALARYGHDVTATDISTGMLSRLADEAARLGVEVGRHHCDAIEMDFPPGTFDGVVARNILWTLEKPRDAVKKWAGFLKEGGVMVLADGKWNTPRQSARRLLDGERDSGCDSGGDSAGVRFEAEYGPVRSSLPMYVGPDVEDVRRIMSGAGFTEILRLDHEFAEDPFGMPESGFFVLAGWKG